MVVGVQEAEIDEGEAANLARAFLQIAKKRKIKPDPEALAWGNLAGVLFSIYSPRIVAFFARRAAERKEAAAQQPAQRATADPEVPMTVFDVGVDGNLKQQIPS